MAFTKEMDLESLSLYSDLVESLSPETAEFVMALATRSYHLPGYGLWQDIRQYISNNHPLLGIFFHHKLHPIKTGWRVLIFLGSILFGLTISNLFFLLVLSDERYQQQLFVFTLNGEEWYVTSGLLMLWTVGGSMHAMHDITIWYITSCACCFSKRCFLYGHIFVVFIVVLLLTMASLLVLVRASIAQDESLHVYDLDSAGLVDDLVTFADINKEDVHFLLGYVLEFTLALAVYYPFCSLVLFSGVLGCGRLPILGGRPRDIYLLNHKEQESLKDDRTMYSF